MPSGPDASDLQYITNACCSSRTPARPRSWGCRRLPRQGRGGRKKATDAAEKVRRWGDVVELEPMSAFDRASCIMRKDDPDMNPSVEVSTDEAYARD